MPQIKQVLRCYAAGKGTKSIASLLDLSRTTVKKYINTFNQCGKSIEEVLAMEESDLLRLFNESRTLDHPFRSLTDIWKPWSGCPNMPGC